jgi:hypothetical protein
VCNSKSVVDEGRAKRGNSARFVHLASVVVALATAVPVFVVVRIQLVGVVVQVGLCRVIGHTVGSPFLVALAATLVRVAHRG